jgi:hypothetical protein
MTNHAQQIEMVGECTSLYHAGDHGDSGIIITIEVPRRFADLWIVKLSDLRTTDEEIKEYEPSSAE